MFSASHIWYLAIETTKAIKHQDFKSASLPHTSSTVSIFDNAERSYITTIKTAQFIPILAVRIVDYIKVFAFLLSISRGAEAPDKEM